MAINIYVIRDNALYGVVEAGEFNLAAPEGSRLFVGTPETFEKLKAKEGIDTAKYDSDNKSDSDYIEFEEIL